MNMTEMVIKLRNSLTCNYFLKNKLNSIMNLISLSNTEIVLKLYYFKINVCSDIKALQVDSYKRQN